jgi:hypothetical protein
MDSMVLMDPNLFGQILILERDMAVRSEFKSAGSENPDFTFMDALH